MNTQTVNSTKNVAKSSKSAKKASAKKPIKKAVTTKKVKVAKKEEKRVYADRFEPSQKITLLVKENPYREKSFKWLQWNLLKNGMSVADFVKKGGKTSRLHAGIKYKKLTIRSVH